MLKGRANEHKHIGKEHSVDNSRDTNFFMLYLYGMKNGVMENKSGEWEVIQILKNDFEFNLYVPLHIF